MNVREPKDPLVTFEKAQELGTVPEKETLPVAVEEALALGARVTVEAITRAVREILRNIVGDIL
jgi:hypothetical protein